MQPRIERNDARASDAQASSQHFTLPVRVYYEDTDAGGVVYYANYLKFCERARTEWLRALGVSQQALIDEQGLAFVVRSVHADYLASARLDDALTIATRVAMLRRASLPAFGPSPQVPAAPGTLRLDPVLPRAWLGNEAIALSNSRMAAIACLAIALFFIHSSSKVKTAA